MILFLPLGVGPTNCVSKFGVFEMAYLGSTYLNKTYLLMC